MAGSTSREPRARLTHGRRFWAEDDGAASDEGGVFGVARAG